MAMMLANHGILGCLKNMVEMFNNAMAKIGRSSGNIGDFPWRFPSGFPADDDLFGVKISIDLPRVIKHCNGQPTPLDDFPLT